MKNKKPKTLVEVYTPLAFEQLKQGMAERQWLLGKAPFPEHLKGTRLDRAVNGKANQ